MEIKDGTIFYKGFDKKLSDLTETEKQAFEKVANALSGQSVKSAERICFLAMEIAKENSEVKVFS